MNKLEHCPFCGGNKVTIEYESQGWLHGCLIGCTNIMCGCPPVISFGLSKSSAKKRVVKKWNRGVDDGKWKATD